MRLRTSTFTMSIIVLAVIVAAGCAPAPTPTAAPTAVPSPTLTSTPLPTDTPVPTATFTATPDIGATQTAEAAAQAKALEDELKAELDSLGIPTDTGSLGWHQEDPAEIKTEGGYQDLRDLFDPAFTAADFAIASDVTWDTTGIITCGLALRSKRNVAEDDHYLFEFLRLSGLPAWSISYFEDGEWKYGLGGQSHFADAIDMENGATNRVVVTAIGNEFNVYINGVRQSRLFDDSKKLAEGLFGYSLWQESGHTTCKFENTSVWVYE